MTKDGDYASAASNLRSDRAFTFGDPIGPCETTNELEHRLTITHLKPVSPTMTFGEDSPLGWMQRMLVEQGTPKWEQVRNGLVALALLVYAIVWGFGVYHAGHYAASQVVPVTTSNNSSS